jgi:RNA recognition motif-containing protein
MFKIFVGNLGHDVVVDDVRALFERHATIEDIALPVGENGKLRGFAIVMIKDPQQGRLALMAARGSRLGGRMLIINQARKKGKAPPKRSSRRASFRARATGMYGVKPSGPGGGPSRGPGGPGPVGPGSGRGDRAEGGGYRPDRGGYGGGGGRSPRDRDSRDRDRGPRPPGPGGPPRDDRPRDR